jgi:hypothetical protein
MIHADEESVWIEPDPHRPGFFIPYPEILQVTAMTAQDAGDLIDECRAEYGMQPGRGSTGAGASSASRCHLTS